MANIEDLDEDFILCNVCNNEYDDNQRAPKLLPCLHTLCNDCALNASKGSIIRCTLCEEEHPLTSDLQLMRDTTMKNMMDLIRVQRRSSSIPCSDCPDNNTGEQFCKDCYVFLCDECTSAHKRTQLTRRHVILSLDELKHSGIGSFSKKEVCSIPGHEGQPFSFYCESQECQKPVCTQCVVGEHSQANGHVIRNLSDVFEESKVMVERLVGELLTKISEVSSEAKQLESETSTIDEKGIEMNKQVESLFANLETLLRKRRDQLKERVDVICQEKKNRINQDLQMLQKSKSDMENTCNYSSRMLVFTNKPEFLDLKSVVVSKLNNLVNMDHDVNKPEALELTFDAGVEEEKFQDLIQSIGEVGTNVYDLDVVPKVNGTLNTKEQFKLPYRGPPKYPPGSFTSPNVERFPPRKYESEPVRTTPPLKKFEPLKFNSTTKDEPPKPQTVVKAVKTNPSPVDENILGRPLTLKSPVITTNKQPSSLGDFLSELQSKSKRFLRDTDDDDEAQEVPEKEIDRQNSRTSSSTLSSPSKSSPMTPPVTSPYSQATSSLSSSMSPYNNPYSSPYSSKGYQSPQSVTSSSKYSAKSPTTNGNQGSSFIQNSFRSASTNKAGVPRLDLSQAQPKTPESPTAKRLSAFRAQQNSFLNNTPSPPVNYTVNGFYSPKTTTSAPVSKNKYGVTWKLDQKDNNGTESYFNGHKEQPISPKSPGKNITASSYQDVKTPSPRKTNSIGGKPTVFGDISCPDFQMDHTSAHHEREVSRDGRSLRNKKTDIYGGSNIDLDNNLVQYKGAIGTLAIKDQPKVYYEVDVVYNIQQPLEETWLVFEIGICRLDDVDMHHTVERHEFARSFYVARYPEDGKLTQEFWHNRDLLNFLPLSDNEAGIEVRITYGFMVDTKRKKWIVVDCNNNKVLHSFDMLDFTEALYPVFGCYNPDLCTVEMTLKTGSEITMIPQCLKQHGYRP